MPALDARMMKHLSPGHHLKGDAAEAYRDFDARVPRVLALRRPLIGQRLEVMVAADQVVGDTEESGTQGAIAVADQRAVRFVYIITLVTGRT
jgi:hypothetical protein